MNYEIEFKISGLTEEKYNEVMDLMKGMPNAKIKKPVTDSEYVPEFAQSTQEGGTEYGSKMVKAVEKFLKEEPEEAKRLWNEVESMRLGEPEEEGGTLEAEEVLDKFVFFPQYIKDDVIPAMTEYASQVSATDKNRIEELEFGYNEAIRQAGNAQDTLIKRIEELEAENEILKMENSHSKLVVDEAKREIDRLRIDNMAHEFDQAEGEKFAPEYEKQIREDEAEKWKKEVERLRGLVERNWTDDLVIHFTSNIILGNTNGKLLGEYMKEFKANNNLLTAYGHK